MLTYVFKKFAMMSRKNARSSELLFPSRFPGRLAEAGSLLALARSTSNTKTLTKPQRLSSRWRAGSSLTARWLRHTSPRLVSSTLLCFAFLGYTNNHYRRTLMSMPGKERQAGSCRRDMSICIERERSNRAWYSLVSWFMTRKQLEQRHRYQGSVISF